jgi:hypothetical protein
MLPKLEISADAKQRAYDYYVHHRSISLPAIAASLGVSTRSFSRLKQTWGWPPRRVAMKRSDQGQESETVASPSASFMATPADAASGPSTLREAALSLAQVTRIRIDALVKEQHSSRAIDHDKTARTLAAYAKTLTTAQALLEQEGSKLDECEHHERQPRTIHELRDELARHLERVVAEEEARGRDGILV